MTCQNLARSWEIHNGSRHYPRDPDWTPTGTAYKRTCLPNHEDILSTKNRGNRQRLQRARHGTGVEGSQTHHPSQHSFAGN